MGVLRSIEEITHFFPIDSKDLIKRMLLGAALGSLSDNFSHMNVTFGAFRGHFEATLSMSTSNFMCDACVMHTCTGLVGPKRGKVKKRFVSKRFLKGSKEPRVI